MDFSSVVEKPVGFRLIEHVRTWRITCICIHSDKNLDFFKFRETFTNKIEIIYRKVEKGMPHSEQISSTSQQTQRICFHFFRGWLTFFTVLSFSNSEMNVYMFFSES